MAEARELQLDTSTEYTACPLEVRVHRCYGGFQINKLPVY